MKFGRILMVHFVNQFLQARFGFRCGLEREQQVIEGQVVGDGPAIVSNAECRGGRVPGERDQLRFVNWTSNDDDRLRAGIANRYRSLRERPHGAEGRTTQDENGSVATHSLRTSESKQIGRASCRARASVSV